MTDKPKYLYQRVYEMILKAVAEAIEKESYRKDDRENEKAQS